MLAPFSLMETYAQLEWRPTQFLRTACLQNHSEITRESALEMVFGNRIPFNKMVIQPWTWYGCPGAIVCVKRRHLFWIKQKVKVVGESVVSPPHFYQVEKSVTIIHSNNRLMFAKKASSIYDNL